MMNVQSEGDGVDVYEFDAADVEVVLSTVQLISKVLGSRHLADAEREVVLAIAEVFKKLPDVTNDLDASLTVIGPTRRFGDHEIYHYWSVEVSDEQIEVGASGHFYRPSTGGDSFTSFRWVACPGFATDLQDFTDSLQIVDDAKPFGVEIDELDLNEPGYSIKVIRDGEEICAAEDDED